MGYQIEITSSAKRAARRLPKRVRIFLVKETKVLATNPLAGEKLKGKYKFLRSLHLSFRGTAYRVIYEIDKKNKKIYIRYAGSREKLYRELDKLRVKALG